MRRFKKCLALGLILSNIMFIWFSGGQVCAGNISILSEDVRDADIEQEAGAEDSGAEGAETETDEPMAGGAEDAPLETDEPDYILGRPMTEEELQEQYDIMENALKHLVTVEIPDISVDSKLAPDTSVVWGVLPSSYDSRSISAVTSVKNQNPYGTCWDFSIIACMESSLIRMHGLQTDLSEKHLAYFTNYSAPDLLGNDYMDSVSYTGTLLEMLNRGGHAVQTYQGLACWKGAVEEAFAPYENAEEALDRTADVAYQNDYAHLQGFYYINKTDVDAIKNAIIEYGTVNVTYYADGEHYNADTAAYYYNDGEKTNHEVAIVGWDDNYARVNFNSENRPGSNGAWLVKNSWGTDWGKSGYFWLSYEDTSIGSDMYVYYAEPSDNYDNNYQYDFAAESIGYYTEMAASVFTVKGNGEKREELKAVAIDLGQANVKYSIQIYRDPDDPSDPTSGTPMLSKPQTGETVFAGYYTIPLSEKVMLDPNDEFAVVFSLSGKAIELLHYYS